MSTVPPNCIHQVCTPRSPSVCVLGCVCFLLAVTNISKPITQLTQTAGEPGMYWRWYQVGGTEGVDQSRLLDHFLKNGRRHNYVRLRDRQHLWRWPFAVSKYGQHVTLFGQFTTSQLKLFNRYAGFNHLILLFQMLEASSRGNTNGSSHNSAPAKSELIVPLDFIVFNS